MLNRLITLFLIFHLPVYFLNAEDKRKVKPLSPQINSLYHELAPIFTPSGNKLFFCREGDPFNKGIKRHKDDQDIYVSELQPDLTWSPARHIEASFNSKEYDFPVGVSSDGKTLYVSNAFEPDGTIQEGISYSRYENGKWSYPVALKIHNFYNKASNTNYYISLDGKTLILNLERDDSEGGMDIYVSFLQPDKIWSSPVSLGGLINTRYNEVTPYLAQDNKTLYFSSNRPGGLGGYDMYFSRRLDDSWQNWTKPENMGESINSSNNETSYIVHPDGLYAVFTTDTKDNGRDIYIVELPEKFRPEKTLLVAGKVSSISQKPLQAEIFYERISDDTLLGVASADDEGNFLLTLPYGERYAVHSNVQGYMPVSTLIDLRFNQSQITSSLEMIMAPVKKGSTLTLNNVFFKTGSDTLDSDSYNEINKIIKMLKENPHMEIEIGGHTDNQGKEEKNRTLSQKRADSVLNYMVNHGISLMRLRSKGYSSSKPVMDNETEPGRQKNRRVEIIITRL